MGKIRLLKEKDKVKEDITLITDVRYKTHLFKKKDEIKEDRNLLIYAKDSMFVN